MPRFVGKNRVISYAQRSMCSFLAPFELNMCVCVWMRKPNREMHLGISGIFRDLHTRAFKDN